jgi:hypothetical protein
MSPLLTALAPSKLFFLLNEKKMDFFGITGMMIGKKNI